MKDSQDGTYKTVKAFLLGSEEDLEADAGGVAEVVDHPSGRRHDHVRLLSKLHLVLGFGFEARLSYMRHIFSINERHRAGISK